jgi:hypothetical protein
MSNMDANMFSIKLNLNTILEKFLNIEDDNFEENMEEIKLLAEQVKIKKSEIKAVMPVTEMKKFNLELEEITKKIKNCFDNIVEEKEKEIKKVSCELNKLTNEKKLALYKRW